MARLLIADDHDVVICGLRQVIRAQDRWEIVAEAGNERQALAVTKDHPETMYGISLDD